MTGTKSVTRASQLHDTLKTAILRGEFRPGEPLRLAALASKYNASQSIVREALGRLAENNLAELTPNQGFRMVDISRSDLIDITDLRVMLEGEALRQSIAHGGVSWEASVISAHHVLERAAFMTDDTPGTTQEWSAAHGSFHIALVSACTNTRMLALTQSLRDGAELYRQLSGVVEAPERDVAAEHRELMELATTHDERAVAALERHLRRTTDHLLSPGVLS